MNLSILLFIIVFYCLFILVSYVGLKRLLNSEPFIVLDKFYYSNHFSASVIIPCRNLKESPLPLITNIACQLSKLKEGEILLIDDYSNPPLFIEGTNEINNIPIKVIRSRNNIMPGKKGAIELGVIEAKYPYILTTDADCIPGSNWVYGMLEPFSDASCKMTAGLIKLQLPDESFISSVEGFDFYGLVGASAGAAEAGLPFMCNGASLGYRREAFEVVGGYDGNREWLSGDDVFLLHKIIKQYGKQSVKWCAKAGAEVTTSPVGSLQKMLDQRIRWASKAKGYRNNTSIVVALLVLASNIALTLALFSLPFSGLVKEYLTLFLFKGLVDYSILNLVMKHFEQGGIRKWYVIVAIIYPIYTTYAALLSLIGRSGSWLNRDIKRKYSS